MPPPLLRRRYIELPTNSPGHDGLGTSNNVVAGVPTQAVNELQEWAPPTFPLLPSPGVEVMDFAFGDWEAVEQVAPPQAHFIGFEALMGIPLGDFADMTAVDEYDSVEEYPDDMSLFAHPTSADTLEYGKDMEDGGDSESGEDWEGDDEMQDEEEKMFASGNIHHMWY